MNAIAGRLLPVLACATLFTASAAAVRPAVAAPSRAPEPGTASKLQGVYCTSRANCWAVGSYNPQPTVSLNEVLHWTGSTWRQVPVPNPAGEAHGDVNNLVAVRCATAADCWAVGTYEKNLGAIFSQALHWTGRKWLRASIPSPGGTHPGDVSELFDVVCTSSANCWAAGDFGANVNRIVERNEALHWNGKKWSLVRTPNPGGTAVGDVNSISSIRCTSQARCLAVGSYGTDAGTAAQNEALRWNGRRWLTLTAPNPAGTGGGAFNVLSGLACSSPGNCWAVGIFGSLAGRSLNNEVLHWNGTAWSQVIAPAPNAVENLLSFVTCGSPANCWAVGTSVVINVTNETAVSSNQALHWDGGMWSLVETPDPGGAALGDANGLNAVRCTSRTNCWAVGMAANKTGPQLGQILHWDGVDWSVR